MLRDLITWVLNTYLGKYLENLNSAQLSVALLSGEVELENVPIRKDALRSFGLPIEVSAGSIRKIKLQVPVRQFTTSPWCISVEGLFCVICPKDIENWDDTKEKVVDLEYKLTVLDAAEAKWRSEKGQQIESYYFSSYNSWLKYGTNMATNIIDNIELKISDVHFRYEDAVDVANSQIAAGIKIGSLTAQSCDCNWVAGANRQVNNEKTYKIVELNDLSLYWDILYEDIKCQKYSNQELLSSMSTTCEIRPHKFIIKPISATARWKREKCQQLILSKDRPRVSCEILVPEVIISLSNIQHGQMLDKIAGIRKIKEIRNYRLKRPGFTILEDPKLWWKYVLDCHGITLKTSEEKFLTFQENLRYMRLYQKLIRNPNENLTKDEKSFKSIFESDRNVADLIILRRICFEKVFTKGLSLKSHDIKGKGMLFHWFPNWMGWYGNNSSQNSEQDEGLKNLEDDILVALEDSLQSSSDIKRDAIFGYFTIQLLNGRVILNSESEENGSEMQNYMEMQFKNFSSFLQLNPLLTSHAIGISLGEICLLDKTNEATKHPFLIKPQLDTATMAKQADNKNTLKKTSVDEPLFELRYENNNQIQFSLNIKSKSLDITYNTDAVHWLLNFFHKSQKTITIRKKNSDIKKKNFINNWNEMFVGNESHRKSWTFEIEVFAPRIIFLENYKVNNSLMILMDFGKFQMLKTDFQNKASTINSKVIDPIDDRSDDDEAFMTPCSTPPASEKSGSESPTLHENLIDELVINKDTQLETALHRKIYNKYTIHLTDLQVLVCKYQERWQASLKSSSNFHLIDKFNITLALEQRTMFTSDPDYPAFTLIGTLPTILIHGNEENINNFFDIMHPITCSTGLVNKSDNTEENKVHLDEQTQSENSSGENRLVIQFVIGQMIIEMQSKEKSIAELQIIGARAGLVKTSEETNITMSVHGLLLVDAIQSFGPDFELLVASHRHVGMDSFSGSLKHSTACSPVTPGSPDHFIFQRPTSPHIINSAVQNIQKGFDAEGNDDGGLNALITIEIKIVAPNANNPFYLQTTNIAFNNLDIIANQDTILELMDFTKRTILNQKIFLMSNKGENKDIVIAPKESEDGLNYGHNEIVFDFFRLNILILYTINRENYTIARKVGTLTMSEAKICASIQPDVSVRGSLGGIQIIDITPEGICHQRILAVGKNLESSNSELHRQSIIDRLSNEIYFTNFDDQKYEEMNALNFKIQWSDRAALKVHVRMASVWYTHCPRFLQDLNVCVTHFKRSLRQFFTSIGNKATDMAKEFVQQIKDVNYYAKPTQHQEEQNKLSVFSLDVIINSPVIILPVSNESTEVLVANLGKISCCNTNHYNNVNPFCGESIETYDVEIRNINLYSLNIMSEVEDRSMTIYKAKEMYSCKNDAVPILHDTAISLKFSRAYKCVSNDENHVQTFSVEGSMVETLKISLFRKQYEQLIDSIQNATNFSYGVAPGDAVQDILSSSTTNYNSIDAKENSVVTTIQFSVPVLEINLQNEHHETLINIIFKDFKVNNQIRGNETDLEIILKSVLMEDLKSEMTSPFRSMVTSINLEKGAKTKEQTSSSCPDLPNLFSKYKNMSLSMPCNLNDSVKLSSFHKELQSGFYKKNKFNDRKNENLVIYKSHIQSIPRAQENGRTKTEKLSSIEFNCLNLAICVDRWFMIFDFFGLVSNTRKNEDFQVKPHISQESTNEFCSKLRVSIRSLNFTLIRNESQLSRVNVSNATFIIFQETNVKTVEGCLGSISLYDLTKFGHIYKQKFVTSGTEAVNFVYKKKLSELEALQALDSDSILRINMSSVHYVHTKRFVIELHLFIKELLQLQTPVIKKLKLQNVDRDRTSQPSKIKLSIQADSPLIVLPASYNSNYVLVANLGKFTLKNRFHFASDECVISKKGDAANITEILDVMHIDLVNINLFSGERCTDITKSGQHNSGEWIVIANMDIAILGRKLFNESCYLKLQVERNLNTNFDRVCPDISVKGTFSKLNGILDIQQYKLIKSFLNNNLGEQIDDVYYNYANNLCQSIEKLSALQQFAKEQARSTVHNLLSITILLEDVSILLVLNSTPKKSLQPLTCIHFIKSSLEIDSFSDGSQDIDLISSNILIVDERTGGETKNVNVFRNILQPSKKETLSNNTVQAEIHCRKRLNSSKYTIMLNNMRVMAILRFLEEFKNYIQEEPLNSAPIQYLTSQVISKSRSDLENSSINEFVINITDSEIIFVEQCSQMDSNAIILKSTTVISYKPNSNSLPLSININHLEIFSCSLDAEDESALSIIDPFTLNIELRNNCLGVFIHKNLNIRLSYVDMKLFSRMLQSIPSQTAQSQTNLSKTNSDFEKIAPLLAMGFEITDCWSAMELNNWKLNESAIWLSQQKHNTNPNPALELKNALLDANLISICVIDDCMDADVPLLEISLSKMLLKYKFKTKKIEKDNSNTTYLTEGDIETEMSINYYNRRLSGWEPVAELWECTGKWKYIKTYTDKKNIFEINIDSKQILKLNITSTLIELFNMVFKNWTNDFSDKENKNAAFRQRTPFIPFALQNLTGTPLLFKPIYAQLGDIACLDTHQQELIKNWISVQPNEVKTFDFSHKTKMRHIDSHQLNLHQILVQIHGWTLIGPISIDKVGVFFRATNLDAHYAKKTRIVFEISLIGSAQKLIKVRSALSVINKLDREIILKMVAVNDQYESTSNICAIGSQEQQCIPLKFIDASLYIKHNLNRDQLKSSKNFGNEVEEVGFSNHEISWKHCGKDYVQNLQICYDVNKSILYTLMYMTREIYLGKEPNLPGHTITLLPPLKLNNMLCCDLIYEINGSASGRISSSESVNIYNVNISESFNLSITLDNFQLSGQLKVPMSHNGIVEPKLKLIDIQNRELHLRISIQYFKGKGMEIYISAPVWIINKTGLPLIYKQEGASNTASGQFDEHERARQVSPLMFSFSDQEGSPALEVRLGSSYGTNNLWCKSFSIHKNITHRELRAEHTNGCYAIGISVRRGRGIYSCTTFVTLSPRFQLHNKSGYKLEFAQKCDIAKLDIKPHNIISAPVDCNFPFHWPNWDREPLICVRIADVEFCCWSKGIPINEVQSLYINVRNEWGEMFFLRLEVISKGATYVLLFTDARSLPPPIRIDNCSEVVITFFQMGSKPHWPTPVRPQSSLSYVMDDPLGNQTLLMEAPGGNTIEFPINKTNTIKGLTYSNFIYIAFHKTFDQFNSDIKKNELVYQQLVLGVRDKKVIIMEKNSGDRSQLWLMNSNGQIEHEGSSPPFPSNESNSVRMVLDLERPPNPTQFTKLVVRAPNKQRITTQTWRFENGRLMCHANMCVQAFGGLMGLKPNAEAGLGRIELPNAETIPIEQNVVAQKLRPGSGQLEVSMKMDGPICTVQICDIKLKLNDICLAPDLLWTHASLNNRQIVDEGKQHDLYEYLVCVELPKGIGVSIITRKPCEEIMYISLENISADIIHSNVEQSLDLKISYFQIDNQLLDAVTPVSLHSSKISNSDAQKNAIVLKLKTLPSPNKSAIIFKYLTLDMKPCIAYMEERLILKVASFLGYGKFNVNSSSLHFPNEFKDFEERMMLKDMKRYYFENFSIGSTQVRLSALTSSKLPPELQETKKALGLTLIKFEDALIELDKFSDKYHFETMDVYLRALKIHYVNQIKWHAASILGSVDFLGNPLGFANDLSEGVSGLIFEGSVKSLVKNVTHGISNSTAKLTETLSDSLGRVVLDDHDNETRQRILELQSNTSSGHLAAGIKGFGFGLLGGVTSIVRHTYDGAQADGVPGFLSGLGKGLVGTVTKPIIGVLDLASETASAVRETSRGTHRNSPDRKRLPRCVTGAPGGLLPSYSSRQSKGQQYLYIINRRNFDEKIISYEPNLWSDKEARLRLLVSTEFVRVFSLCDGNPTITFESHLSEILSCHPLITNSGTTPSTSKMQASYYIEISTNLPKITRPRIRCRTEESAETASRCINYAKSVFDEREHSL
ncbi:vacuolar protein sorting-associated protein 13D [Scaptodrosophila lebanonensis]|uniref:Vacuolar protein sorting-associated protein 13D n=1 Tax=Drosophila lebanonensis TaxID=7225 RepID=A0A6J2TIC3_DROLE|nr:vacuolar protein sorting-associated protein 13D [Scaptodrosophila lebanonensis]